MNPTEYFMRIAEIVKLRSGCNRKQVGTVFVVNKRIVSTGYNQAASGMKHCSEVGCTMIDNHCVRAIHSELNGILNATRAGQSLEGATAYVTLFPCIRCLNAMINAGVNEVVFKEEYACGEPERPMLDELREHIFITRYEH